MGSVCDNRSTDENWIPPLSGTFCGICGQSREHAGPVRHDLSRWASDNTMGPKGRWQLQCAMTIPRDNDTSVLTYLHGAARGDPSGGRNGLWGRLVSDRLIVFMGGSPWTRIRGSSNSYHDFSVYKKIVAGLHDLFWFTNKRYEVLSCNQNRSCRPSFFVFKTACLNRYHIHKCIWGRRLRVCINWVKNKWRCL